MTRSQLLLSTALVLAGGRALGQTLAPNALPTGMQVVAGSAGAVQHGASLTVNQTTQRAALNWTSFNIGSGASVRFQDPSAQSLTINRVTNNTASTIAGHLSSNGEVVLINQSGVVFTPTAVVDAQSLVVSASGITEQAMKAGVASGKFRLDQAPAPGAKIVNQGRISVRKAGLAALVAPSVANSGTVSAPFGQITLAGVSANVVDLYGDGLLSLDVTRQTIHGATGQAALVTNDGLIAAAGGRVTLSTAAVDGLVSNLVQAGGTISVDNAGAQAGRVLIDAEGGNAVVTGLVSARGLGAASSGGRIGVLGSEVAALQPTARLDASGTRGGGLVAIGTTLARARGGPGTSASRIAKIVSIAPGASVDADATGSGDGGRITILSTDSTVMAGSLSARGGTAAGNGGAIEISGQLGYRFLGTADSSAPRGSAGSLTIDPFNLTIDSAGTATLNSSGFLVAQNADAIVSPATLEAATGNITLEATASLIVDVSGATSLGAGHTLNLQSDAGSIDIFAVITSASPINLQATGGGITIEAGGGLVATGAGAKGALTLSTTGGILVNAAVADGPAAGVLSGSTVQLSSNGAIQIGGTVTGAGTLNLLSASSVTEESGGTVNAGLLENVGGSITGTVNLTQAGAGTNLIDNIGPFTVTGGDLLVEQASGTLNVLGAVQADGLVQLTAQTDIGIAAAVRGGTVEISANGGALTVNGPLTSTLGLVGLFAAGTIALNGNVTAQTTFELAGATSVSQSTAASINAPVLTIDFPNSDLGTGISGTVSLPSTTNVITTVNGTQIGGNLTLADSGVMNLAGRITVGNGDTIALSAANIVFGQFASLTALNGVVELAPVTAAPVTVGGAGGTGFSVPESDLSAINANTLRIGQSAGTTTATSLTVSGSFNSTFAEGPSTIELDAGNGGIAVNAGPLAANTLLFGTSGSVTQSTVAGSNAFIQATTLASVGTIGGSVSLLNQANSLSVLGSMAVNGDLSLWDQSGANAGPLFINGPVSSANLTITAGADIDIQGNINTGALTLNTFLNSNGGTVQQVNQNGQFVGTITASSLTASVAVSQSLALNAPGNNINTLNAVGGIGTQNVTVASLQPLTVNGLVQAQNITFGAPSITETASGALSGLPSEGPPNGTLSSIGTITTDAILIQGSNTLSDIANFAVGGTLSIANSAELFVDAGVVATKAAFHIINSGALFITQPITLSTGGTLDIRADALTVTGGATSDVISGAGAQLIAIAPDSSIGVELGGALTAGGLLLLPDNLTLNAIRAGFGTQTAPTLEIGGIEGTPFATGITLNPETFPGTFTLRLDTVGATGSVVETGGVFATGTLGGSIGGDLDLALTGATNQIGNLAGLSVGGNATLADATALQVIGAVNLNGGTLEIADDTFRFLGNQGSIAAGATGVVRIGPLASTTANAVLGNSIAADITLGDLTTNAVTAATLEIGSSGIAGTPVAQAVELNGTANFGGVLLLNAGSAGVVQLGGTLGTGALGGDTSGAFDVAGGGVNAIPTLDAITAGSVTITDGQGVTVHGVVTGNAGNVSLIAPSISVDSTGELVSTASGGQVLLNVDTLSGPGSVVAPGSVAISPDAGTTLTVGLGHVDLSIVSTPTIVLNAGSGGIVFSGAVTPGGFTTSAGVLELQAANTLVTQDTGGSVTAGTLTGIAGTLDLGSTLNAIGALGAFSVGLGDFTLASTGLTVTGAVVANSPFGTQTVTLQAPNIVLAAGGSFSITSAAPGALVLETDALSGSIQANVPQGTVSVAPLSPNITQTVTLGVSGITAALLELGGAAGEARAGTLSLGALDFSTAHFGTLELEASTSIQQSGALIFTGLLEGKAGTVTLDNLGNQISHLGTFTATAGNLTVQDAHPLTVTGTVTASGDQGILTLNDTAAATSGTALTLAAGSVLSAATVSLGSTAGVSQDATGILTGWTNPVTRLTTPLTLTGTVSGGDMLLLGTGNAVAALGSIIVAGTLNLVDSYVPPNGAPVTQIPTGTLAVGTLAGQFASGLALLSPGASPNAIGALGNLTAVGSIELTGAGTVAVAGDVSATPATPGASTNVALQFDGLTYAGGVLDPGTLEIAPRIDEPMLIAPTGAPGVFLLDPAVLANTTASLVRLGQVHFETGLRTTATGITLDAAVALNAAVATLDLETQFSQSQPAGPVTETANGTLSLLHTNTGGTPDGTLTGLTGAVSLTGQNNVPQIGPYTAGGTFALTDADALTVVGDVSASGITLATAGALSLLSGNLLAPGGTVDLTAAGATQSGGTIDAAVLQSTGPSSGTFALTGLNAVGALGPWNGPASTLSLTSTGRLQITGPVNVSALSLLAQSLTFAGPVTVANGLTVATTQGGITQPGGTISTAGLTSGPPGVQGATTLDQPGNAIQQLSFYQSGGAFSLADGIPLNVVGTVIVPTGSLLQLNVAGQLSFAGTGTLAAAGSVVDLVAAGATQDAGGDIVAATLLSTGTPSGNLQLVSAGNTIDSLGPFIMAAGGTLALRDTKSLAVSGAVSATVIDLSTLSGGVTETTGSLAAATLQSSFGIVGGATLDAAGNVVGSLGTIAVSKGNFDFTQAGSLAVAGAVSADNIRIATGNALAIGASGSLSAPQGTVDLTAGAGITEQPTGVIAAAVLTDRTGGAGSYRLTGANRIAILGSFAAGSENLFVNDLSALTVAGPVALPGSALGLSAPSLTLAGPVTVATADFTTTAGDLTQTAGTLSTDLLSSAGGIAGSALLNVAANQIGAIGNFQAAGQIVLADASSLIVGGMVSAPQSVSLSVAGAVADEAHGGIATALLTGSSASADLTRGSNGVIALAFTTTGPFALTDTTALTVQALSAQSIALRAGSGIVLAGAVNAPGGEVSLIAQGPVTQSGGTLAAGLLAGNASAITLTAANQVAVVGDVTAPGGFDLVSLADPLQLAGTITAGTVTLATPNGPVVQSGGAIVAQLVQAGGAIRNDLLLGSAANQVASLGPVQISGELLLRDTEALTVGNISASIVDLSTTAGGVTQTGPVFAGTLRSSSGIVGGAAFSRADNVVQALGPMTVTGGDLTLVSNGIPTLTVVGAISAPDITLSTGGAIAQQADINTPGTLSVTSGNVYDRAGGALNVGVLTGRAVSSANFGSGAQVATLGAFTVNDSGDGFPGATPFSVLTLTDAIPMRLQGPLAADYIALTAAGSLTWAGNLTTLGQTRVSQIANPGTLPSPGTFLAVTPGADGRGTIAQIGTVQIFSQDGALSTVRLQLPPGGGSITLQDLQAPSTDLVLSLGPGSATGSVNLGDLLELLTPGVAGSTNLLGTVRGLAGPGAAQQSDISPSQNANYRVNSCAIASVNCILLPLLTVPATNPLSDLAIGQARDQGDDNDVLLPSVSDQDY